MDNPMDNPMDNSPEDRTRANSAPPTSSSDQPWLTDRWAVSQHNFDSEIAIPPHPVQLHDITVRDGW